MKQMSSFDLTTGREEVLPKMKVAHEGATAIFLEKYIYVIGGVYRDNALSSCER